MADKSSAQNGCVVIGSGVPCPPTTDNSLCTPFDLTDIGGKDNCFIEGVIEEALDIGGAIGNVFKLLGVHEQGSTMDLVGDGIPFSSGMNPSFPVGNAFNVFVNQTFHSIQKGAGVTASAFIGYDFGTIQSPSGREIYGTGAYDCPTSIRKHITTIKIQQQLPAVTRARIERSDDKKTWYGVDVIDLPADTNLNQISFQNSVRSRYWRIRPLIFDGGNTNPWIVSQLQLIDYDATKLDNIQDKVFFENRARDYQDQAIQIKGSYDLLDVQTELTRFGIELPSQTMYFTVSFNRVVTTLGRPPVIGDIIELPSETQFSPTLEPILKYMEITDVGWSTDGFTPGWKPTLLRLILQPMLASEETQDIFGGLGATIDDTGLTDMDDGNHPVFQDYSEISQEIEANAKDDLPLRGREGSSTIREWEPEEIKNVEDIHGIGDALARIGQNRLAVYAEDAMPPNDAPYTEGDAFPPSPNNGDYHRLTYSGLAEQVPARLHRWSTVKTRWIFLEKDKRFEYKDTKPMTQDALTSDVRTPPQDITKYNTKDS